jgi:hypothetical protein
VAILVVGQQARVRRHHEFEPGSRTVEAAHQSNKAEATGMSTETEQPILTQIHDLVAEEKQLRTNHAGVGLTHADRDRLEAIERELDQCWVLLRQRRAADDFGTER